MSSRISFLRERWVWELPGGLIDATRSPSRPPPDQVGAMLKHVPLGAQIGTRCALHLGNTEQFAAGPAAQSAPNDNRRPSR